MNVTLTVNVVLPAYMEGFFVVLTNALATGVSLANVGDATPAAEPKKRGRPAKSAEASGAELPTAPAETAATKPAAVTAPATAPAAAASAPAAGKTWTVTEAAAVVQEVLPKIGVPMMKAAFAKFGAKKVMDVPAEKLGELIAEIQAAVGLVS